MTEEVPTWCFAPCTSDEACQFSCTYHFVCPILSAFTLLSWNETYCLLRWISRYLTLLHERFTYHREYFSYVCVALCCVFLANDFLDYNRNCFLYIAVMSCFALSLSIIASIIPLGYFTIVPHHTCTLCYLWIVSANHFSPFNVCSWTALVQDRSIDSDQTLTGQAQFFLDLVLEFIKDSQCAFRTACLEGLPSLEP